MLKLVLYVKSVGMLKDYKGHGHDSAAISETLVR